ncbi:unnamed protein product [Haemonchus placei]|uniref:Protein kinase domain-containing protein n=1 Tax=Haemonchus placei TaxID=6290 RepID=A0A0N4X815_HAEPC|nr:unnamed protein product [Haemonchus placei]
MRCVAHLEPESEKLTDGYVASNDLLRRQELSRAEELPPRLDAFELFLYNMGYWTNRGRTSRDPLGCRKNPEDTVHRGRRLSGNKAEPCFEDNDLMTSFNTKPVSNPGHSLFIPAHHPSELRSRELRRYQEAVYQRLLILLNNFRMNRRTKNWNAQGNLRTHDLIGDWYNDEKEVESSQSALDTTL